MRSKEVLAYTAGILDGEGAIGLYERKQQHSRTRIVGRFLQLKIQVGMTDRRVPDFLHDTWGGTRTQMQAREGWSVCYNWIIQGESATKMLESILPYLIVKRSHAAIVIEYWRNRHSLKEEEQELYQRIIRELNKKSPDRNNKVVAKIREIC